MTIGTKRKLSFDQAKAQFVHRYTMEHVPQWAKEGHYHTGMNKTVYYAPQYRTDLEWYDNTHFDGESELADKKSCHSFNASWPLGHWLDKPFKE